MLIKITKKLELEDDATEAQILAAINDLQAAADVDKEEASHLARIKAGEHDQVGVNEDGSLTITLAFPFKSGSELVEQLVLRRPKGKNMRAMDAVEGDMTKALALLGSCAGKSLKEMNELDGADIVVGTACLGFFNKSSRRTGAVS
jgi:hypothetical protein